MNIPPPIPAWNPPQAQIILATLHAIAPSCVSDTQQTTTRSHRKVASVNSSASHRLDFLPSVRPSLLSVMLLRWRMFLDEN